MKGRGKGMNIQKCSMDSFAVIGKEGSINDGQGFIGRLWADATEHFHEVEALAQKDEDGKPLGFWGAMSDMSRSFRPWEDNLSKGLYLAGVQCALDAQAPAGWVKWIVPACEYLYVETEDETTFSRMIGYMNEQGIELAGAVHDFICPQTGKNFQFFPICKL